MKAVKSANEWLFGYGSPVTIGLFRAFMGSIAFVTLALTAVDFQAWYTESGFVPSEQMVRWSGGMPMFTLLGSVTDSRVTAAFYALTMLAAFLTAIGLFTRVSSIALLVGVVSIHHRNPEILHSGDTLLRAMLFFVALAPSGKACSIDRLIGLWRGTAPRLHDEVSLWPQRMMQIQLAIVYVTTVWHKSFGATWHDGTATYYPTQLSEFDRFPVPAWFEAQAMVAVTTWGTLLLELALGTLVFNKQLRKPVLIGGLLLHASIEYRFNIPMFALTITSCYIVFYQGEEVVEWAKRMGKRLAKWKIVCVLPKNVSSDSTALAAAQAADPFALVAYEHGEGAGEVPRGALVRSIGAWPLVLWPPAWKYLRDPFACEAKK